MAQTLKMEQAWYKSPYAIFVIFLLTSIILRLPFTFSALESFGGVTFTSFDEGSNINLGLHVLSGKLPYVDSWENRPAMYWLIYAVFAGLSGGSITAYRIIGSIYVATTGYVLYWSGRRAISPYYGLICGLAYILYCTTAFTGQSFVVDQVVGLPIAFVCLGLLKPKPSVMSWLIASVWAGIAFGLMSNYAVMFAIVPIMQWYDFLARLFSSPRPGLRKTIGLFFRRVALTLFSVLCFLLPSSLLFAVYYFEGYEDLYILAAYKAILFKNHHGDSINNVLQLIPFVSQKITTAFNIFIMGTYNATQNWLICLLAFVGAGVLCTPLVKVSLRIRVTLLLLMAVTLASVGVRSNLFISYYIIQLIIPLVLIAGITFVAFDNVAQNHPLQLLKSRILWAVVGVGVFASTANLVPYYKILYERATSATARFYDDPLFDIADYLKDHGAEGEYIFVCNQLDIIYFLTHAKNPSYYLHTPLMYLYPDLDTILRKGTGRVDDIYRQVFDKAPLYVVAGGGDGCLRDMPETYEQEKTIRGISLFRHMMPYWDQGWVSPSICPVPDTGEMDTLYVEGVDFQGPAADPDMLAESPVDGFFQQ